MQLFVHQFLVSISETNILLNTCFFWAENMHLISSSASGIHPIYHPGLVNIFQDMQFLCLQILTEHLSCLLGYLTLKYRNSLSISSSHISQSLPTDSESRGLNCFIGKFLVSVTKVTDSFKSKPYRVIMQYQKYVFNRQISLILYISTYLYCFLSSAFFVSLSILALFLLSTFSLFFPDALVSLIYHFCFYFPSLSSSPM